MATFGYKILFKNGTHLLMLIIYARAVEADKLSTPIAAATGVLFLFDYRTCYLLSDD